MSIGGRTIFIMISQYNLINWVSKQRLVINIKRLFYFIHKIYLFIL